MEQGIVEDCVFVQYKGCDTGRLHRLQNSVMRHGTWTFIQMIAAVSVVLCGPLHQTFSVAGCPWNILGVGTLGYRLHSDVPLHFKQILLASFNFMG